MGQLDQSLEAATETLRLRAEALGETHQDTITSRHLLATIQLKIGRVSEAVATLATTVELLERIQGADNSEAMTARYLRGAALRQGGLHQESVDVLTRLIDDHKRVFGEKHPEHGTYLASLAASLQSIGDAAAAISAIDRAVELGVAVRGLTHPTILVRRLSALSMREWAGLAPNADDVKPIIDALTERFGSEHPDTLAARHLYALLLGRQGAVGEALDLMRLIAASRKRLLGASHVDAMRSQAVLGHLQIRAQRFEEALATMDELLPHIRALRRSVALFGPAAQRQVVAQFQPYLAERIILLARSGRLADAFVAIEEYKAQTLLEQMARHRAFAGAGLPVELSERLRQLSSRHVSFESNVGTESRAEPRDALLLSLGTTHEELEVALREATAFSPRFARLLEVPTSTASDLDLLKNKRTAFVHYVSGIDDKLYALVASPDQNGSSKLRWFELGDQRGLSASIDALRAWTGAYGQRFATDELGRRLRIYQLDDGPRTRWLASSEIRKCEATVVQLDCVPHGARAVDGDRELNALREHISEQLLVPLLPTLAGSTNALISPDGALGLLPWDTLFVERKFAHQRWQISVTPSLAVLKAAALRQQNQVQPPRALLAFAASLGRVVNGEQWPALPYTEIEATAAVALFREQRSMAFVGKNATRSNLSRLAETGELSQFRRILIAAHGRFDSKRAQSTAIILADDQGASSNGVLTVADWVGMPLNSELVLLSACDSARGQLVSGEGLIGFGYALNVAGNQNLLATLWSVTDRASSDFVLEFLRNINRGLGHSEALNLTKRFFSQHPDLRRRNPRVWGAFVLIGR